MPPPGNQGTRENTNFNRRVGEDPVYSPNGQDIVQVSEPRDSEALLLCHGWMMTPHMWAHSMEALKGRIRCLAPWAPSHGAAAAPPEDFTLDTWVKQTIRLLDVLSIDRVVMAGHSMGGFLTLALAVKYPERIKGLVLVGTLDEAWPAHKRQAYLNAIDSILLAWDREPARRLAEYLLGEKFLREQPGWFGSWFNEASGWDLSGMGNLHRAIAHRPDLCARMSGIRVPTLVVHGELDKTIELTKARAMSERIPGATLEVIPDAAHCPPLEVPERFTQTLVHFLEEHELVRKSRP